MPPVVSKQAGGNWFSRLKSLVEAKSLATPDATFLDLFGINPTSSGIQVSAATAMTCAPVRCAVQAISEAVGQLPVHVYERAADGSKGKTPEHPAYKLLHDQANDWTPASDFRETLTRDALLYDNGGFAFINRVEGRPYELTRLPPGNVSIGIDERDGGPVYKLTNQNKQQLIPRENILHIRSAYADGFAGQSPVSQARETIALALVMERHAARLFGNGARPSGVIKFPKNMTPEALAKAKAAWLAAHGGEKSGGTAVLDNDADWKAITLNSVDAQFLELRAFAIAEIGRVFRMPPVMMQDYTRQTWANAETGGQQFLTYTLMPWLKRWEGELRLKLFNADERQSHYAEFLTDDLLRADFAARMEGYSKAIAARIINPNEARAAENRPPYAGGDAFVNPNTMTAGAPANV